jgi:hypothetical protein
MKERLGSGFRSVYHTQVAFEGSFRSSMRFIKSAWIQKGQRLLFGSRTYYDYWLGQRQRGQSLDTLRMKMNSETLQEQNSLMTHS